jgi:predicted Zn-dependent protease
MAILLSIPVAQAVPVGMDDQLVEFDDLLNSNELSRYSRDLFGSVISAVRSGDHPKAKLLIRRMLAKYPEHPLAWEFDGTLKLLDGDIKAAERSLVKSLTYMPERASARAKMGLVRLTQNNTDSARKLFQETLSQDPHNWIAHRYLAKLADAEGNTRLAVEHYQRIVKPEAGEFTQLHAAYARDLAKLKRYDNMVALLEPLTSSKTDPELTLLLSEAYLSQGNIEAARQQLEKAKNISPDNLRIQLLSAIDQRLTGQAEQSVKQLQLLIGKDNDNALFHYHHALALLKLDKSEQALTAFDNAVAKSPHTSSLRVMLAREFEQLGQPEKVISTLEPLVKTQARKDVAYILIQAYVNAGKWSKALIQTEGLIEKHADFVPARLLKIQVLRGLQKHVNAETYAQQTVSQFPSSVEALKVYTQLLSQNKNPQQTLRQLKLVAEEHPENRMLALMLANQYQANKQPQQAEKIYRTLLTETPGNAGLLNNLAIALSEQTGKLDEALVLAQQAHENAPDTAAITDSLGWVLHLTNHHSQALEMLNLALKQQPELFEAQCHLGLSLYQQGSENVELLKQCLQPALNERLQVLAMQALGQKTVDK